MSIDQAAGGTGDPVASPQGWTFWADNATPPYAPIGQVACTAFTCTWALSGFGAAEAVIPVAQGAMGRLDLLKFYSYRLWAYYGPTLVWGGLATGLSDDGGPAVTVALAELPGYLNVKQYATTQTYTQVEQTTIAGDLAGRLDNIGVPRLLTPGSGFKRNRTYTYLQGQSRGDLLEQLTQVTGGPEFRSEYSLDTNGRPVCALHIAYPRVGSSTSGLALVVPGGAVTFTSTWTSEQMRTRTFSVGDLPPNSPGTATKPSVLVVQTQAGVPEIDHVDDWPGVTDTSTLTERANTFAAVYAQPAFTGTAAGQLRDRRRRGGKPGRPAGADRLRDAGAADRGDRGRRRGHGGMERGDHHAAAGQAVADPCPAEQ